LPSHNGGACRDHDVHRVRPACSCLDSMGDTRHPQALASLPSVEKQKMLPREREPNDVSS
jgi:hypothetical protein